jgi:uncharacterized protein with HEPN domain
MQPEKADAAYLWDMLDAARAIREFVGGKTLHDYLKNRMLRGAVERHVEIIGEAANRVSTGFQASHPEIPWRKVINQRNVLVHEYGDIKHELLWRVATERITELIPTLEALVPQAPVDKET